MVFENMNFLLDCNTGPEKQIDVYILGIIAVFLCIMYLHLCIHLLLRTKGGEVYPIAIQYKFKPRQSQSHILVCMYSCIPSRTMDDNILYEGQ